MTLLHTGHQGVDQMMLLARNEKMHGADKLSTFCCEHAPLNAQPGPLPQAHPKAPFEMITADVGQLANGNHFIAIADRFGSLVAMYDLVKTGTSSKVIGAITKFVHNNLSQLKQIFWDNASNFKSTEIENWAEMGNFSQILCGLPPIGKHVCRNKHQAL
jgi:hypothetical protein